MILVFVCVVEWVISAHDVYNCPCKLTFHITFFKKKEAHLSLLFLFSLNPVKVSVEVQVMMKGRQLLICETH